MNSDTGNFEAVPNEDLLNKLSDAQVPKDVVARILKTKDWVRFSNWEIVTVKGIDFYIVGICEGTGFLLLQSTKSVTRSERG